MKNNLYRLISIKFLLLIATACGNNNRSPYGNYRQVGFLNQPTQVLTYETPKTYDNSKNKPSIQKDPIQSKTYQLSDRDKGFHGVQVDFQFKDNGQLDIDMKINGSYIGENNNSLTYTASNVPYRYDQTDNTIAFEGRIRASRKTLSHTRVTNTNHLYARADSRTGIKNEHYRNSGYPKQSHGQQRRLSRNYKYDPTTDQVVDPYAHRTASRKNTHLSQIQRSHPISSLTLELSDIPMKGTQRKAYAKLDNSKNDRIAFEENLILRAWEMVPLTPCPTQNNRYSSHQGTQHSNGVKSWGAKPRSITTEKHSQSAGLQFDEPQLTLLQ